MVYDWIYVKENSLNLTWTKLKVNKNSPRERGNNFKVINLKILLHLLDIWVQKLRMLERTRGDLIQEIDAIRHKDEIDQGAKIKDKEVTPMIKGTIKKIARMIRREEEEIDHLQMIAGDPIMILNNKKTKSQIIQKMSVIILERIEMHVKIERLPKNWSQWKLLSSTKRRNQLFLNKKSKTLIWLTPSRRMLISWQRSITEGDRKKRRKRKRKNKVKNQKSCSIWWTQLKDELVVFMFHLIS